jgi:hypothetical protein
MSIMGKFATTPASTPEITHIADRTTDRPIDHNVHIPMLERQRMSLMMQNYTIGVPEEEPVRPPTTVPEDDMSNNPFWTPDNWLLWPEVREILGKHCLYVVCDEGDPKLPSNARVCSLRVLAMSELNQPRTDKYVLCSFDRAAGGHSARLFNMRSLTARQPEGKKKELFSKIQIQATSRLAAPTSLALN